MADGATGPDDEDPDGAAAFFAAAPLVGLAAPKLAVALDPVVPVGTGVFVDFGEQVHRPWIGDCEQDWRLKRGGERLPHLYVPIDDNPSMPFTLSDPSLELPIDERLTPG